MDVIDILHNLGYSVGDKSNGFYRTKALYRGGNNPTSLSINAETGWFHDFVTTESGPLHRLVSLTLNLDEDSAKKYIGNNYQYEFKQKKIEIEEPLILNSEEIKALLPSYLFYKNRGISEETLKLFGGGVATHGKMNDRFVFPIFNSKNQLIGLAGRDLTGYKSAKWKLLGRSRNFLYPFNLTKPYILECGHCILCESIGDCLALWEAGIRNTLVIFGLKLHNEMLKLLISLNLSSIIISLNNDSENKAGNKGLEAAEKIKSSLSKFFSVNKIMIIQPVKKDFGAMHKEEILDWKNNILAPALHQS